MSRCRPAALTCLFSLLAALALVARVAVPAGWMPVQDDDGVVRITLCTAYGLQQAWIDEDGKVHRGNPDDDGKGSGDSQPHCPFMAGAMPLALGSAPDVPAPHYGMDAPVQATAPGLSPGRGLAAPPPPQTGPPLTA